MLEKEAEIPLINSVNFIFRPSYVKTSKVAFFMQENCQVTGHGARETRATSLLQLDRELSFDVMADDNCMSDRKVATSSTWLQWGERQI